MGKLDGSVALVIGSAKGQGRSHALTLAREGAEIVLVDNCVVDVEGQPYPGASKEQLDETTAMVQALGRRCVSMVGDVRLAEDMERAAQYALSEFGAIDHLICNAGILLRFGKVHELSPDQWRTVIDTNLTGVFMACRAVLPHMVARRRGTITITASTAGRSGFPNLADYNASKWGVIGLMKSLASEYGSFGIRVNCVAPSNVNSGKRPSMTNNEAIFGLFCPDIAEPTRDQAVERMRLMHPLGVEGVDPEDVSKAILYLVSDDARYISGEVLHVAAGLMASNSA
ncbi:mycofactocin-coupled SDR family oxidoreductase [uncultured Jatrophihabitans sp.]|uniref:mycofactocin-coupled SDR family oxidoreductase n=1 Tax=uncultured Jatrophihabitans sp. TaxID=1610747 RepID=UPI0035C96CE8